MVETALSILSELSDVLSFTAVWWLFVPVSAVSAAVSAAVYIGSQFQLADVQHCQAKEAQCVVQTSHILHIPIRSLIATAKPVDAQPKATPSSPASPAH